jgi:hypothetical protein
MIKQGPVVGARLVQFKELCQGGVNLKGEPRSRSSPGPFARLRRDQYICERCHIVIESVHER